MIDDALLTVSRVLFHSLTDRPMGHGLFSSLRSLLACLLALSAGFGGLLVLGFGESTTGDAPRIEAQSRIIAAVIAERLEDAFISVERDLALVAESLALMDPDARPEAAERLFTAWRRLRPDYAHALLADKSGRILASSLKPIVGADVSGSPWFSRAVAGVVIGEAAEGSRAGMAVPRNVIVAVPVGRSPSSVGVVAVQLSPGWTDAAIVAARRSVSVSVRNLSIGVMNGAGRSLYKSGPEIRGQDVSATVGDVERGGLGWLVTVRLPEPAPSGLSMFALLSAVLIAAIVGWLLGGLLKQSLAVAEALCRQEDKRPQAVWSLTRDLHALTTQIRATVDRSLTRERLLQEKRFALARSRDRIRAIRALSGATCWEIDPATGQVVWTDGAEGGDAPERICALNDMLAHFEPGDRAALGDAVESVQADRNAMREVVVRARSDIGRISGRSLSLRIASCGTGSPRVYALSRAYIEPARAGTILPRPSLVPDLRSANATIRDSGETHTVAATASGARGGRHRRAIRLPGARSEYR